MHPHTRLAVLAFVFVIFYMPERTLSNPYGYYGSYSRTRRDPTAWNPAYAGMAPNPVPLVPNAMGRHSVSSYGGGHVDNQGVGMGGSFGQDANIYGVNQYRAVDNTVRNPMVPRMDSTSQHGSMTGAGGSSSQTDLNGYQSQSHYSSQVAAGQGQGEGPSPDGCGDVVCDGLNNCINVTSNDTQCCPQCIKYGCICQGYQVYDCQQNGFVDGTVPEGKSYMVAGGTTVCSCPPGGGSITCSFHDPQLSKCPELPPNCVRPFAREIDGCDDCAMFGCTADDGTVVEEGMNIEKPPCSICYCPVGGGKLICGVDKSCQAQLNRQAMGSTIRELNPFGHSSEATNYDAYDPYRVLSDYKNQYSQNAGGVAPVVPALSQIGTGGGASATDVSSKGSITDGKGGTADSAGYNPYSPYQQQYGVGYSNPYEQYPAFGQGNRGYGNFQGYPNYGYNHQFAQAGAGYPHQVDEKGTGKTSSSSTNEEEKTRDGATLLKNTGPYGQQSYDTYRQQPYVPPLVGGDYSSVGNQDAVGSDTQSTGAKSEADKAETQSGTQNSGYPFRSFPQSRYYDPSYYGMYQGHNQFQPQYPIANGAESSSLAKTSQGGSEQSPKVSDSIASESGSEQAPTGKQKQQVYPGIVGQYPYDSYDRFGYYGYQFPYSNGQMPVGASNQYGQQATGQGSVDPNVLPHDSATPKKPSASTQDMSQAGQQGAALNNQGNAGRYGFPYSPYDQQQLYQGYPSQVGSQGGLVNPPLVQPGGDANSMEGISDTGGDAEIEITKTDPQPQGTESSWSRRIRGSISVINKGGRIAHEKALRSSTTSTTTTTTTTPKPTTTTTTSPTTTTTTPPPTTTTTTTTTTKPTTTTTTTKRTTTTTTTPTTTTRPTTTTTSTTTTTTPRPTTRLPRRSKTPTSRRRKSQNGVSLEKVLTGCCSRGQRWATFHNSCDGISVISGTYSRICSVAQEKCCVEFKQQRNCQRGMDIARSRTSCNVPDNLVNTCGASEFKTCCDCCEMGLKAVELGLSCDAKMFGDQCNKAYSECCNSASTRNADGPTPATTTTTAYPETRVPEVPKCATHGRCQQSCTDTSDGMVCRCRRGYRLHENRRDCVDVNECVLNTHTCTEHQICLNREGTFFCKRKISCGTGYELTEANECEDIDECALNIDDCLPNTDCENIRGSYRCIPKLCDKGYITDATGRCIDIDECRTRVYSCPRGASCFNTEGSYECRCPIGLSPNEDNSLCEDIDECTSGAANCKAGSTCINTMGSFICQDPPKLQCAPGYYADEGTRTCLDIDECSTNTHTCKAGSTCINEDGSFRCEDPLICPEGMTPDEEGQFCRDIDECQDRSLHRCNDGGACVNLIGSFKCLCKSGYENAVTESGLPTCRDIDECATEKGAVCSHECRNLPGSFQCHCPTGYEAVDGGRSCEDIDECGSKQSSCDDDETCFNTHGTYKCVDLSCPAGYTKISNTRKSRRCTRQSCRGKPRSCLKQPKQISFHNISLTNGTVREKPLFRMSLARTNVNDRYEFLITDGNSENSFKVKSSTRISRPTGVVYTAGELTGPKDYVIDLSLKLNRGRRHSTFVSRLYIFVGRYNM